ncbi:hypothetical protein [Burkholderia stagnalis]|uniref:hypothetical protein n=1 Tax=Burkholderia stagnalis TaxID=1503054 RepID=UPI003F5B1575
MCVVTARVDAQSIRDNARATRGWSSYGLDYAETRFSRLKQIDAGNIGKLGLVWSCNLESTFGGRARPWSRTRNDRADFG